MRPTFDAAAAAGKRILWPRVNAAGELEVAPCEAPEGLVRGRLGVLEPSPEVERAELAEGDLLIVPGVAFTHAGERLGRGGGHYDRLLAEARAAASIGVAFDIQIVREVPMEPHDRRVDWVVTENGIWRGAAWRT